MRSNVRRRSIPLAVKVLLWVAGGMMLGGAATCAGVVGFVWWKVDEYDRQVQSDRKALDAQSEQTLEAAEQLKQGSPPPPRK